MNKGSAISAFRKFLRGLLITGLGLLLPCQLFLLWLATLDGPVRLPDFVGDLLTERLAAHGLNVRARSFRLRPDGALLADDISLEVAGLTGDLLKAEQLEIGIDGGALLTGRFVPTHLRLRAGSLWCPASVSRFGQRRLLAEEIDGDFAREGRWLAVPSLRARAGKLTLRLLGELPAGLLAGASRTDGPEESAARRLAFGLAKLEHGLVIAEQAGGASIELQSHGVATGGASIDFQILLGNTSPEQDLGVIRTKELRLQGRLSLDPRGAPGGWRLNAQARTAALAGFTAEDLRLSLSSEGTWQAARGELSLENVRYAGLGGARLRAEIAPQDRTAAGLAVEFALTTTASRAEGRLGLRADGRPAFLRLRHATLSTEELRAIAPLREEMRRAHLELGGDVLMQDCETDFDDQGRLRSSRGRLGFSGGAGLGVSAHAICPEQDQPLVGCYDFTPTRLPYPLLLSELRLATVKGDADCSLQPGGAFRLNLRGDIAPASLDRVLGTWWIDLWKLFGTKQSPYASIWVEGRWGQPQTTITSGRVRLENFTFMRAPVRSVEVSIAADHHRTSIGLHRLFGGSRPEDGFADGSAVWDWTQPLPTRGPVVKLAGNLHPWVAAACISPDLGATLRGLSLPRARRFELTVTPREGHPAFSASLLCPGGNFRAWDIPGRDLKLLATNESGPLLVEADLGLAGGRADLRITGDPLKEAAVTLNLKGCQPKELGRALAQVVALETTPPPPEKATSPSQARLDLGFKGQFNPSAPRQIRGLGNYTLTDPELRKVRILGGISGLLETIGVDATTYDLTQTQGRFGCLGGKAFFPDMRFSGPQSQLDLSGQIDLTKGDLNFEGDFSLASKGWINLKDLLNRPLISLTKIRVKGTISNPEVSTFRQLSDIINPNKENNLGKIPAELYE